MKNINYRSLQPLPSISSSQFDQKGEASFRKGLIDWRNEMLFQPEYSCRDKAVEAIKKCCAKGKKALDLNGLNLTSLPEEIGDLEHLEELDLEGNQLDCLPDRIFDLHNLVVRNKNS